MPKLSKAVHSTAQKKLPLVPFQRCFKVNSNQAKRAYSLFTKLGYAEERWVQRTRKYGSLYKYVHPVASEYLKCFGDLYLIYLSELVHPSPDPQEVEEEVKKTLITKAKKRLLATTK